MRYPTERSLVRAAPYLLEERQVFSETCIPTVIRLYWRTVKLPKSRISIPSPRPSAFSMHSKTVLITASALPAGSFSRSAMASTSQT